MSGGEIRKVKTTFKRFHRNNELQRDDLRSHGQFVSDGYDIINILDSESELDLHF